MKRALFPLLFLFLGCSFTPFLLFAQTNTIQVTSVTLKIDTIRTIENLELARNVVLNFNGIHDFDMKGSKSNFAFDPKTVKLAEIETELAKQGFVTKVLMLRENQVFTQAPVDNKYMKEKPELTEEDAIRKFNEEGDK